MKNWVMICGCLIIVNGTFAQTSEPNNSGSTSTIVQLDSLAKAVIDTVSGKNKNRKFIPKPKLATRFALIPGGGQIYNRDYWKLPIIYLGLGGGAYTFYLNSIKYKDYLTAYKSFYDLDKQVKNTGGEWVDNPNYGKLMADASTGTRPVLLRNLLNTERFYVQGRLDNVKRGKDYWRRNRNLSIVTMALIYGLTMIEANVAAHLKTFDLSEDLSLNVRPKLQQPFVKQPTPGLYLVFNFR